MQIGLQPFVASTRRFEPIDRTSPPPPHLSPQALEARCCELRRELAAQGALLAGDLGRLARESNALRAEACSASNLAKKVGGRGFAALPAACAAGVGLGVSAARLRSAQSQLLQAPCGQRSTQPASVP
jgi:hypothetical protein